MKVWLVYFDGCDDVFGADIYVAGIGSTQEEAEEIRQNVTKIMPHPMRVWTMPIEVDKKYNVQKVGDNYGTLLYLGGYHE